MASSDRIVANQEQLVGGDGTVAVALQLWCSRNGLVMYSQWQSLYFHLVRAGFEDEEAVEGESAKDKHARISRLFREIQEDIHGPDYFAPAVIESNNKKAKAVSKAAARGGKSLSDRVDGGEGADSGAPAGQEVGGGSADGLLSQPPGVRGAVTPVWQEMNTPRSEELAEPSTEGVDLLWLDEQAQLVVRETKRLIQNCQRIWMNAWPG